MPKLLSVNAVSANISWRKKRRRRDVSVRLRFVFCACAQEMCLRHHQCARSTKCIYNQLLKSGHIDCCARTRITSVA